MASSFLPLYTGIPTSMQRTPPSTWKSRFPCSRRHHLHGFLIFHAADAATCMDFHFSMQPTPPPAWISIFPCSRRRRLHGDENIHAERAGVRMEINYGLNPAGFRRLG